MRVVICQGENIMLRNGATANENENHVYFAVRCWCQTEYRDWLLNLGHQNTDCNLPGKLNVMGTSCDTFDVSMDI